MRPIRLIIAMIIACNILVPRAWSQTPLDSTIVETWKTTSQNTTKGAVEYTDKYWTLSDVQNLTEEEFRAYVYRIEASALAEASRLHKRIDSILINQEMRRVRVYTAPVTLPPVPTAVPTPSPGVNITVGDITIVNETTTNGDEEAKKTSFGGLVFPFVGVHGMYSNFRLNDYQFWERSMAEKGGQGMWGWSIGFDPNRQRYVSPYARAEFFYWSKSDECQCWFSLDEGWVPPQTIFNPGLLMVDVGLSLNIPFNEQRSLGAFVQGGLTHQAFGRTRTHTQDVNAGIGMFYMSDKGIRAELSLMTTTGLWNRVSQPQALEYPHVGAREFAPGKMKRPFSMRLDITMPSGMGFYAAWMPTTGGTLDKEVAVTGRIRYNGARIQNLLYVGAKFSLGSNGSGNSEVAPVTDSINMDSLRQQVQPDSVSVEQSPQRNWFQRQLQRLQRDSSNVDTLGTQVIADTMPTSRQIRRDSVREVKQLRRSNRESLKEARRDALNVEPLTMPQDSTKRKRRVRSSTTSAPDRHSDIGTSAKRSRTTRRLVRRHARANYKVATANAKSAFDDAMRYARKHGSSRAHTSALKHNAKLSYRGAMAAAAHRLSEDRKAGR